MLSQMLPNEVESHTWGHLLPLISEMLSFFWMLKYTWRSFSISYYKLSFRRVSVQFPIFIHRAPSWAQQLAHVRHRTWASVPRSQGQGFTSTLGRCWKQACCPEFEEREDSGKMLKLFDVLGRSCRDSKQDLWTCPIVQFSSLDLFLDETSLTLQEHDSLQILHDLLKWNKKVLGCNVLPEFKRVGSRTYFQNYIWHASRRHFPSVN